jgi:hypothetical protein
MVRVDAWLTRTPQAGSGTSRFAALYGQTRAALWHANSPTVSVSTGTPIAPTGVDQLGGDGADLRTEPTRKLVTGRLRCA